MHFLRAFLTPARGAVTPMRRRCPHAAGCTARRAGAAHAGGGDGRNGGRRRAARRHRPGHRQRWARAARGGPRRTRGRSGHARGLRPPVRAADARRRRAQSAPPRGGRVQADGPEAALGVARANGGKDVDVVFPDGDTVAPTRIRVTVRDPAEDRRRRPPPRGTDQGRRRGRAGPDRTDPDRHRRRGPVQRPLRLPAGQADALFVFDPIVVQDRA
jgi:hypothetical protein